MTMESQRDDAIPFPMVRRSSLSRTSAEIVKEARQSLRSLSTKRPHTPRDGARQLFGGNYVWSDCEARPPSTFSIHALSFDAPDSRPGSGTRLSPIDHKPRLRVTETGEELARAHPRPPTEPPNAKRGLQVARTRPPRAGSATSLPPLDRPCSAKDRASRDQRCPSEKKEDRRLLGTHHPPPGPGPQHIAAESRTTSSRPVDPAVGGPQCAVGQRTDGGSGEGPAGRDQGAESQAWEQEVLPLLDQLGSPTTAGRPAASEDLLCELCARLHAALARGHLLGRRCKRRAQILRMLFALIDRDSARLHLHVATLCLALCVSGNNLLNICKLIYKISRSESNDRLFQSTSILDALLVVLSSEDVCVSGEALLYSVAALKFLSGNDALLRQLLAKGCVGMAQPLLQKLHPLSESGHALFTTAGHILLQLTSVLRNLADLPESRPHFLSHGILSELCVALRHHQEDADVCTNIARIYSKLSSYAECRLALDNTPYCYQLFLDLLNKHHKKQDLVVRLLFTLGNLTSRSDAARARLYGCGGFPTALLRLYRCYLGEGEDPPPVGVPGGQHHDVLVKLVRVLANVCVHPAVGVEMASDALCLQLLMETLELRPVADGELLVNVAATINNLSFHQQAGSAVRQNQLAISQLLLKLMLSSNMEAVLEATRVYGNLTQWKEVRDLVMRNKVYQFLVTLLDSQSGEVCFAACGVLTNLSLDPPSRATLTQEGVIAKLVDCLRDLGPGDWQLAGQVCQTLWNLTEPTASDVGAPLRQQERETLLGALIAYSCRHIGEEEAIQWTANNDMRDYHKACWEMEFLPVARKLKDRLQPLN
ncbi:armadillo repeat-containing protein 2 isoform X1 [Gadus morhua]|uniref:armadillo repeat-containing protein 2 isoform X1 n=1 Tax=Gadus morhua TaxID=8049 RepID=UPI0011B72219|nr:armadillo repeat-containing protein 2 isoform X1 [Gadus morhua]XP_030201728.1 armadillo repeat-containing protein 2 isoform X1 [Gadus morhua]